MTSTTKRIFAEVEKYFFICIGLAIFAFGWTAFLIPNQITGGGISGISAIIYFAYDKIPVSVSALILNLILIAIAWRILGRRFCIDTLVCSVILSLMLQVGQSLFPTPLVPDDPFLCAMIGAALSGFGIGLVLTNGGNTGGTDIIVLMIAKYRKVSYGRTSLYLNIFIVLSSILITHDPVKLVYSVVVLFAYIVVSDLVIDGFRQTFQFMVFSKKNHEIAERINKELHRGATFLKGTGSYNHQDTEVLLIISHRTDQANIIRIIKDVDSSAFISISKVQSVFGKNFEEIK
ncbi:MAG: YitT family protein [Bacteroidales bacterium]|nr:YitT family protein [Bacteroidales bacterium]